MKIALVYDAVYPWVKGGGEKHLWELAVGLRRRGHEVHCFGMQYWPGPKSFERDGVWLHGVCRARPLYDADGKRSTLPALLFAWGLFVTLMRKPAGRLDVIDSIVFPFFSIFAIALWRFLSGDRTPWLLTWLEIWGRGYWRRYLGSKPLATFASLIERACARFWDRHLCISRHQATRLHDLLGVPAPRIEVIPRGLDLTALPAAADRAPARLLYLGRLLDYKNVAVVIRALSGIRAVHPDVSLRIVGSGPEEERLRRLTEELQLDGIVEFVAPKLEAADALMEIAEAGVLVQPSTREGMGAVVLEAQAIGTPVVATQHPESAVSELVEGGRGVLVERWDDPVAWSDAIIALLGDAALRDGIVMAARESAREYDSSSAIVPRVEQLYERLCSARAERGK